MRIRGTMRRCCRNRNGNLAAGWLLVSLLRAAAVVIIVSGSSYPLRAEETLIAPDGNLTIHYPRHWQAEASGERIRLTAPDDAHYLLLRDTISISPGVSPAANPELKKLAIGLVRPLLPDAVISGAQSLTMDHGVGAAFRFHGASATNAGESTAIYIAFIGSHSVVLMPEKAGQAGQSIGLSGILQSLSFADALPRPAPQRPTIGPGATAGSAPLAGPATVSFTTQIAPILKERCEVCHRASAPLGGYSVTSYADVIRGGRHGGVIVAGRPESSPLLDYLTGKRELMPRGGPPLPADQVSVIRKWVAEGARQQLAGPAAATEGQLSVSPLVPGAAGQGNRAVQGIGAGRVMRDRLSRPAAAPAPSGPQLLEAYAGHLVAQDIGFSLRLYMDHTATAVWTNAPGTDLQYSGSYTGADGTYVVSMAQPASPAGSTAQTIVVELRAQGSRETGVFGLDGARPRREIADLELSETRTVDGTARRPGPFRPGNAQRRPRPGR